MVGEIPGSMGKQVGWRRGISVCTCVIGEGSRTHVFVGYGIGYYRALLYE